MKKEIIYHITDEDKELLKKPLPINPCNNRCPDRHSCCGCPKLTEYDKTIKAYQDADIYVWALTIGSVNEVEEKIKELEEEKKQLISKLPKEIVELVWSEQDD